VSPLPTLPETFNRTECIFIKETSTLSCIGVESSPVECAAELKWDKPVSFHLFGIAKSELTTDVAEEVKFRILPRKLDNSAWRSDVTLVDGKHISLYHSDKYNDYGLLVKDKVCFGKLVALLKLSTRNELVQLESVLDVKPTAFVIGDLLWADKKPILPEHLVEEMTNEEERKGKRTSVPQYLKQEETHKTSFLVDEIKREIVNEQVKTAAMIADLTKLERDISTIPVVKKDVTKMTEEEKTKTALLEQEQQKTALIVEEIKKELLISDIKREALSFELTKVERDIITMPLAEEQKTAFLIEEIKKELLAEDNTITKRWGDYGTGSRTTSLGSGESQRTAFLVDEIKKELLVNEIKKQYLIAKKDVYVGTPVVLGTPTVINHIGKRSEMVHDKVKLAYLLEEIKKDMLVDEIKRSSQSEFVNRDVAMTKKDVYVGTPVVLATPVLSTPTVVNHIVG
jgi:hypothetical protein